MNQNPVTRQSLEDLLAPIQSDIHRILEHLENQNGRLRDAETDIAILKDRQPTRAGAIAGTVAAAIVAVLSYFAK